jgi:hypothetical protein
MRTQINIYKSAGKWYGARTVDSEYDGCDELDCDDDASESDAAQAARDEFPGADVTRVADM